MEQNDSNLGTKESVEASLQKGSCFKGEKIGDHPFDAIYRQLLYLNDLEKFGVKMFKVTKRDRQRIYICCTEEGCNFRVNARSREAGDAIIGRSCLKHTCRAIMAGNSSATEKMGAKRAPSRMLLQRGTPCPDAMAVNAATAALSPAAIAASPPTANIAHPPAATAAPLNKRSAAATAENKPKRAKKSGMPYVLLWICAAGKFQSRTWKQKALRVVGVYATKEAANNKRDAIMSQHTRCGLHGDIVVGDDAWEDEIDLVVRPAEEVDL